MQEKKVAIVVDNNLEVSKEIVAEISSKYSNVQIFDFSSLNPEKFNAWNLIRLIYKIENLDLSGFDLVVSVSSGFANGIVTNLDTTHENIMVKVPNWYFQTDHSLLKHKFRMWLNLALERPNSNKVIYESLKSKINKINPKIQTESYGKISYLSLPEQEEAEYYVVLASGIKSKFLDEIARIFNQTGKKVYLIGWAKMLKSNDFFSNFVEFINIENEIEVRAKMQKCKALIFDQYFDDYQFLNKNLNKSVGVMSFRNAFIQEYFNNVVFELNDIDSFENEFAKFVSWAKIHKKIKCMKVSF